MKNYVCVGLGNIPETSGLTSGALSELKPHYILPSDHVFLAKTVNTGETGSFKSFLFKNVIPDLAGSQREVKLKGDSRNTPD